MFGLKDLSSLPTLKDMEGLGPPPAEDLLPFADPTAEGEEGIEHGKTEILPGQEAGNDEPPAEIAKDPF
jgi:hypothetical protein